MSLIIIRVVVIATFASAVQCSRGAREAPHHPIMCNRSDRRISASASLSISNGVAAMKTVRARADEVFRVAMQFVAVLLRRSFRTQRCRPTVSLMNVKRPFFP
jgi:mevalonate pyrophosphate decarboxylase